MPNTTINSLPYPASSNAFNVPLDMQNLALSLDTKINPVFATNAARDAAIPSPTTGMMCVAAGRELLYRSGAWAKQGGVRELAYENGNAGSSGVVNVGAGATGVLSVNVAATGVAADTAHFHGSFGIKSSGSTVGSVTVNIAGTIFNQLFNIGIATTPIPIVIDMPVSIPAATFNIGVSLTASTGNSANLDYSSLRLTF